MGLPRPELELQQGTRLLDRYVIYDRYDSGGMATIYRAWDERLERVVCIKVLRTTLEGSGSASGNAAFRATYTHFLKEALALSKLQHPNTLRIYDFGYFGDPSLPQEERSPFHVSEFLSGGNLDFLVRDTGPMNAAAAADVIERIASALSEAHGYGILHRDIKPSNILFADVAGSRIPKLADFGIARSSAPGHGHETVANLTLCSPRWASPEQLSQGIEGPATDVYALGLLLHFMLAGRPLFVAQHIRDTFNARIVDDQYVIHCLREARLDKAMEDVLLACLRVNPASRFHEPVAFARAVRAAVGRGEPAPDSAPTRSQQPPRHDPPSSHGSAPVPPSHSRPIEARVRFVETDERADLAFPTPHGEQRMRVSFQPTSDRVNVKSLSGFVQRDDARPSAAVLVGEDACIRLVAADRSVRLTTNLVFGTKTAEGIVFVVDGHPVLVPSARASRAVALFVADTREVVIVARR